MDIKVNEITKVYGTAENRVTALKPASMEIHKEILSPSWARQAAGKALSCTS